MSSISELPGLVRLMRMGRKREAEKIAKSLVIRVHAFTELIMRAAALGFQHRKFVFDHVPAGRREKLRSFWEDLDDPEKRGSAIGNVASLFRERKYLAVHLFEPSDQAATGDFHIFYFSQGDLAPEDNHWELGEHVHYTSHLFAKRPGAERVIQALRDKRRVSIPGVHLRTADLLERSPR